MQALMTSLGKEDQIEDQMDLVALGTVADMVPLVGENRYLVKRGYSTSELLAAPGHQRNRHPGRPDRWAIWMRTASPGVFRPG